MGSDAKPYAPSDDEVVLFDIQDIQDEDSIFSTPLSEGDRLESLDDLGSRMVCSPCHFQGIGANRDDDSGMWSQRIEALTPAMFDTTGRLALHELKQLLSDPARHRQESVCSLTRHGKRPILVTAPHNIHLLRGDRVPPLRDVHTEQIAQAIAEDFGGTCLCWSQKEQRTSEHLWVLSGQLGDEGSLLRPGNLDPNFLSAEELPDSEWHQLILSTASPWRRLQATFHMDVHGCQDPPASPSHLTIGLGAMLQKAEGFAEAALVMGQVEALGEALQAELPHVLASIIPFKEHAAQLVRIVPHRENSKECSSSALGAWPVESGRYTQSQQAVLFAGFTHSVQLEMSTALRGAIAKDRESATRFSIALRAAWRKVTQAHQPLHAEHDEVAEDS
jgi:hypothetical protein